MKAAVEGVVRLDDEAAAQLALEAGVGLIALRNFYARVEAAREVRDARAEVADERRVGGERPGEAEVRVDEGAARGRRQVVRVELDDRAPEREVVESPKECPTVEDSEARAHDRLPPARRVEGEAEPGAEVVAVGQDALALVAQAGREREARGGVPLALRVEAGVGVPLRGLGAEALSEARGRVAQEVARA